MAELVVRLRERELNRVPILNTRITIGRDGASEGDEIDEQSAAIARQLAEQIEAKLVGERRPRREPARPRPSREVAAQAPQADTIPPGPDQDSPGEAVPDLPPSAAVAREVRATAPKAVQVAAAAPKKPNHDFKQDLAAILKIVAVLLLLVLIGLGVAIYVLENRRIDAEQRGESMTSALRVDRPSLLARADSP